MLSIRYRCACAALSPAADPAAGQAREPPRKQFAPDANRMRDLAAGVDRAGPVGHIGNGTPMTGTS
jgi:hypothetical protein